MIRLFSWAAFVLFIALMLAWTVTIHDLPEAPRVIYSVEYLSQTEGGSVELPPSDPPQPCPTWDVSFCTAP